MSRKAENGILLDSWRPPSADCVPVGCLATTYTFSPGLFDEQCLGRFLGIESEPDREDLAFLLERESRLGAVYAGVLVDHTQAGVEHSLRWDVLPVRIRGGKQHAKVSLLAWTAYIRLVVASANLTDAGYRFNQEVAVPFDMTPEATNHELLSSTLGFFRTLLSFVPGAAAHVPEISRALRFLDQVENQARAWQPTARRNTSRPQLLCTLPGSGGSKARSSLDEAIVACRKRGGSPTAAWVASPFFDLDQGARLVTAQLCKRMARGGRRHVCFCVPAIRDEAKTAVPRLAAPKALLRTPLFYQGEVLIEMLPDKDADKNPRTWHAKMLALSSDDYYALMIGSSNFTAAGMGNHRHRNSEANIITIVKRVAYGREVGLLEDVWPVTESVTDPEAAEWLGAQKDCDEEERAPMQVLHAGFLGALYQAGDDRKVLLRVDPEVLPHEWMVLSVGHDARTLLTSAEWRAQRRPAQVAIHWGPPQPPEKLLARWDDREAFIPLNVEDGTKLPPPALLENMSAEDLLLILAAGDPSAAFRAWVCKHQEKDDAFDPELDSAVAADLDPLQRYQLGDTFLHRVRRRARVLAALRANVERPVWSRQALDWRLRGLVGLEVLAHRLAREVLCADSSLDEALLMLADFLIVLRKVRYRSVNGSLSAEDFNSVFLSFLRDLVNQLDQAVASRRTAFSPYIAGFWDRTIAQCRE